MNDIPLLIRISLFSMFLGAAIVTLSFLVASLSKPQETFTIVGGIVALVVGVACLIHWLGW